MMRISEEQLEKLQGIYLSDFGKEISREEAYQIGLKLIKFFLLTQSNITEIQYLELLKPDDFSISNVH